MRFSDGGSVGRLDRAKVVALLLVMTGVSASAQTREPVLTNLRNTPARFEAGPSTMAADGSIAIQILFDREKSSISPEARALLDEKMTQLRTRPDLAIVIQAEDAGSALAQRRAQATVRYLVASGIDARRIQVDRGHEIVKEQGADVVAIVMNAARP